MSCPRWNVVTLHPEHYPGGGGEKVGSESRGRGEVVGGGGGGGGVEGGVSGCGELQVVLSFILPL